jgi:hypothetical protein
LIRQPIDGPGTSGAKICFFAWTKVKRAEGRRFGLSNDGTNDLPELIPASITAIHVYAPTLDRSLTSDGFTLACQLSRRKLMREQSPLG